MTQRDAWHVCNEMSVVGPGLGGLRDESVTKGGTSHNSIPPSRPHLEAWEGWSVPVPWHLALKIKGGAGEGQARIVQCLVQWNSQQHGGGK